MDRRFISIIHQPDAKTVLMSVEHPLSCGYRVPSANIGLLVTMVFCVAPPYSPRWSSYFESAMRLVTVGLLCVIVIAAALTAYWWPTSARQPVPPSQIATVARRTLSSSVLATGTIRPRVGAEVRVGARLSGLVTRLNVTVGSLIKAGQVIAELDQTELRARRDQATAAMEVERLSVANAKRIAERAAALYDQRLISDEARDQSKTDFELTQARLKRAEADMALISVQLGYTVIQAPISGVVASVSTQEGETVAAGFAAPTFVTIISLEQLEAIAFVDETDIGRVLPGLKTVLTVDAYPNEEFTGTVRAVAPKAVIQSSVVNYEVTIDLDNPNGRLKPDMTTNTVILTESREALCAPLSAVQRDDQGAYVLLARDGGTTERRSVTTGWRDGAYTEIIRGLNEGDRLAVMAADGPTGK